MRRFTQAQVVEAARAVDGASYPRDGVKLFVGSPHLNAKAKRVRKFAHKLAMWAEYRRRGVAVPAREKEAARVYAQRSFNPLVGPITAKEWDESCNYKTAAGALVRAALWRRAMGKGGNDVPRSWCLAGHAGAVADARALAASAGASYG